MANFVVLREPGPQWDPSLPMEEQPLWKEHAAFMNGLEKDGFVRLGGPLGGYEGHRALLVVDALDEGEILRRLADDPWTSAGILRTREIHPWEIRLGDL